MLHARCNCSARMMLLCQKIDNEAAQVRFYPACKPVMLALGVNFLVHWRHNQVVARLAIGVLQNVYLREQPALQTVIMYFELGDAVVSSEKFSDCTLSGNANACFQIYLVVQCMQVQLWCTQKYRVYSFDVV